jgi:arylformamidase
VTGWRDITIAAAPGTPEWPGDTPFSCGWAWSIARGDSVNVSTITTSPHVGTHADAPLHVRDEWPGSEELDAERFVGRAFVRTVSATEGDIQAALLDTLMGHEPVERLLLRTDCSIATGTFPERWPVLALDTVAGLLRQGLRLLGVDAPSVDARESKTLDVHHALFRGGATIVENLDLRAVTDGEYDLVALPMKVLGLDAAPVRAFLRTR